MAAKRKRIPKPTPPRMAHWRKSHRNPRLVLAELDNGELVNVTVHDNTLYCDGMMFPVTTDGANYYERNRPRERGRI